MKPETEKENDMKKQYTKRQIEEAIAYWRKRLDESSNAEDAAAELVKAAKQMSPDIAKLANAVASGDSVNEASLKGIAGTVGLLALAACMLMKTVGNAKDVASKTGLEDASLGEISASISEIEKNVGKMQKGLDQYFADAARKAKADDAKELKAKQALFDKIMAED